jgi:hypothetical protein
VLRFLLIRIQLEQALFNVTNLDHELEYVTWLEQAIDAHDSPADPTEAARSRARSATKSEPSSEGWTVWRRRLSGRPRAHGSRSRDEWGTRTANENGRAESLFGGTGTQLGKPCIKTDGSWESTVCSGESDCSQKYYLNGHDYTKVGVSTSGNSVC